jgi:hypothetical protein
MPRVKQVVKQSMISGGSQMRASKVGPKNLKKSVMGGGGGLGPPLLKTQFSIENMLNLNQQNLRLKQHVLLFIEKLESFIGKATLLKEEKRKQRFHIQSEPQNEVLTQK